MGSPNNTYTYHRDPIAGIRSLSETKAGWLSLSGAMQSLILCIPLLSSLYPGLPLLQRAHNHRCSNPRRPAITRLISLCLSFKFTFLCEPHRSEVKGWLPHDSGTPSCPVASHGGQVTQSPSESIYNG